VTRAWLENQSAAAQPLLRAAWNAHTPVCCGCRAEGVPMHIARRGAFVLKRNPRTGKLHDASCPSYAADGAFGRAANADWREPDSGGRVRVPLATPLYRLDGSGEPPPGTANEALAVPTAARTRGEQVALIELLHYLWHEAGFDLWRPAMAGRRDWYSVRKFILQAAAPVLVREGVELVEALFLPGRLLQAGQIEQQAHATAELEIRCRHERGRRHLALVLAEAKSCALSRFSHLLRLKHAAGLAFWVHSRLWAGGLKRCPPAASILAGEPGRAIVLMSVERTKDGNLNAVDLALMATSPEWIPILEVGERPLIEHLVEQNRAFVRPLLAREARPAPSVVLIDTETPRPLFLQGSESARLAPNGWIWSPDQRDPALVLPPPHLNAATQATWTFAPVSAPASD